jgi:hypothetical protein
VRALRKTVRAAADKASWRPDITPDSVGVPIIENLNEYDPGSLHVLELVNAILLKASRR